MRLMYPGWLSERGTCSGCLVGNVVKPRLFGQPSYLGAKLMKRVIHRRNSCPDNAGHGQRSVALEALLGRASA